VGKWNLFRRNNPKFLLTSLWRGGGKGRKNSAAHPVNRKKGEKRVNSARGKKKKKECFANSPKFIGGEEGGISMVLSWEGGKKKRVLRRNLRKEKSSSKSITERKRIKKREGENP